MKSYITGDIFVFTPPQQSLQAWAPFQDCVDILFIFQNSDVDTEHPEWRLYWVAGIALCRTVGHVLAKVDAYTSNLHRLEIDALWKTWTSDKKAHAIFWEFIEKERNNLLKTYTFGATLKSEGDETFVQYEDGSDALQLFREAVYWWRHQLMELERRLEM